MAQAHIVIVTGKTEVGDNTNVNYLLITVGGSPSEDGCAVPTAEEDFDLEVLRRVSVDYGTHGDIFIMPSGVAMRHVKGS